MKGMNEMVKKLLWKFAGFMYGRNGVDQLYLASGVLLFVLLVLQIFIENPILSFLSTVLVIWTFYRFFSRNIPARQAENRTFIKLFGRIKTKWKKFARRMKDISTHRYRTCDQCETTLRLPRKRGTHKARCPRCQHLVEVKILI